MGRGSDSRTSHHSRYEPPRKRPPASADSLVSVRLRHVSGWSEPELALLLLPHETLQAPEPSEREIRRQAATLLVPEVTARGPHRPQPTAPPRLVMRVCSALVLALLAATLALAASGCAVPFVERPAAEVVIVPVA